jgi:hypothetical protein
MLRHHHLSVSGMRILIAFLSNGIWVQREGDRFHQPVKAAARERLCSPLYITDQFSQNNGRMKYLFTEYEVKFRCN